MLLSNGLSLSVHTHGMGFAGSTPKAYSDIRSYTIYSDYFGSISKALDLYIQNSNQQYYDYIQKYRIYSYDKMLYKDIYVPNPSGPGGIF